MLNDGLACPNWSAPLRGVEPASSTIVATGRRKRVGRGLVRAAGWTRWVRRLRNRIADLNLLLRRLRALVQGAPRSASCRSKSGGRVHQLPVQGSPSEGQRSRYDGQQDQS